MLPKRLRFMEKPVKHEGSETSAAWYERACRSLVGGVNSPVRAFRAVGGTPRFIRKATGPYLFDVDGRRYVDLICNWGATIVGHAHPAVVEAVQRAATDGLSFGACCAAEVELAERIIAALPSIEQLRFVSSGTEAVMSAIRLARAATGRAKTLKFIGGYHGHADSLLVAAGSGAATLSVPDSAGVPRAFAETTLLAPYNDLAAVGELVTRHGSDLASILVEPVIGNMGFVLPDKGFLDGLRGLCTRNGSMLIFDEVMTGFRVGWGGYQSICRVGPDITCLGKVIGGGMPVAAYGGPREIMCWVAPEGPMYQAGTLSGNPIGMAAGIATLELCARQGFYEALGNTAHTLVESLEASARGAGVELQTGSAGGMFGFAFAPQAIRNFADAQACDHARYARFFQAMLDRGAMLPPSGYEAMFLSSAHDAGVLAQVVDAAKDALRSL